MKFVMGSNISSPELVRNPSTENSIATTKNAQISLKNPPPKRFAQCSFGRVTPSSLSCLLRLLLYAILTPFAGIEITAKIMDDDIGSKIQLTVFSLAPVHEDSAGPSPAEYSMFASGPVKKIRATKRPMVSPIEKIWVVKPRITPIMKNTAKIDKITISNAPMFFNANRYWFAILLRFSSLVFNYTQYLKKANMF